MFTSRYFQDAFSFKIMLEISYTTAVTLRDLLESFQKSFNPKFGAI